MTTPVTPLYSPPHQGIPITDPMWTRWLYALWATVGAGLDNSGPQGTFPRIQVGKAAFDATTNMVQELLTLNKGLYSDYSSGVSGILYGFACNVRRSSGTNFVVGAQLNAWAQVGVTCPVFGLAVTALAQPGSRNCSLVGFEPDVANMDDANTARKIGIDNVFKNRGDGAATVTNGLGANRYNYDAHGMTFTSQPRSAAGEFCGWSVGIDFFTEWCDLATPRAWSNAITYIAGAVVSSAGVLWKSIVNGNLNNAPAAGSAFWVQRTFAGVNDLGVGIDFSSISVGTMARMASAIRLRTEMYMHWEETGAIGTRCTGGGQWVIDNQGGLRWAVNLATGLMQLGNAAVALGGGAGLVGGTIGGAGPTTAAQNKWIELQDSTGTHYFVPAWI